MRNVARLVCTRFRPKFIQRKSLKERIITIRYCVIPRYHNTIINPNHPIASRRDTGRFQSVTTAYWQEAIAHADIKDKRVRRFH